VIIEENIKLQENVHEESAWIFSLSFSSHDYIRSRIGTTSGYIVTNKLYSMSFSD